MNRRRIKANDPLTNSQYNYADNYIKTSKYTLFTFLLFNLIEQFKRLANTYFLCLLILQLIPQISSLTPITTAVPLVVVLAITGVKDALDDYYRHKSDNQVNNRLSELLTTDGRLIREPWHRVKVGDIIRIENDQFVAADLMILSTSEPNGFCFVETAELDGETNLKCRQSLSETAYLADDTKALAAFDGEVVCEAPNNNLTKFEGTLFWREQKYPIDNDKMLLRGCILRNTKWCFGLVVFAGKDTKLMQNSGKTIFKRTKSDRLLNILIMGIVLVLLAMCLFTSIACGVWELLYGRYFSHFLPREGFIPQDNFLSATLTAVLTFFSYLIVLNTVVPISLYVSVELIRFCQSLLIDFDNQMYYRPKDAYAKARTTTLNEELGQVEYVFSDKTGTLTQNLMTFNKCTINGQMYGEVRDIQTGESIDVNGDNQHLYKEINFESHNPNYYEPQFKFYDHTLLEKVEQGNKEVCEFFTLLALCHTVMSEEKNGRLEYQAQSPDEAALSAAARNFGFIFKNRTSNTIEIEVLGIGEQTYELLAILDFNNVRKRMSVIVRSPEGKLTLYCKGADSVIFERLSKASIKNRAHSLTIDHLEHFAGVGLRTLCLAKRELDEDEYKQWRAKYHNAVTSIEDREQKVDECYEEIEQDLQLLGATAIEDKLQDNVPQTISNLLASGIKLWVLTGDKQETAINIGYSCELLNDDMCEIFVVDGCYPEEVDKQLKRCSKAINRAHKWQQQHLGDIHNHGHNLIHAKSNHIGPIAKQRATPTREPHRRAAPAQGAAGMARKSPSRKPRRRGHGGAKRPQSAATVIRDHDIPMRNNPSRQSGNGGGRQTRLSSWSSQSHMPSVTAMAAPAPLGTMPQPRSSLTPVMTGQLLDVEGDLKVDSNNNESNDRIYTINLSDNHLHEQPPSSSMHDDNNNVITSTNADSQSNRSPRHNKKRSGSRSQTGTPSRSKGTPTPTLFNAQGYNNGSTPRQPLGGGDPNGGFALVISGQSLAHALCPNREELFLTVASQCKSVICCRVTPLQKALVVDLVKRRKKVITLSIGDGANDVSMLKMAHIGVGISGQEGMQAVLASDFSIAQFCYLERLILVHGRWSYFRMCKFLRYFFYKNFSFTLCNFWYAFVCGFSAQTLFDPLFISCYNVFYTSLPVLALGILDQDVNDRMSTKYPLLYTPGLIDLLFNKWEFLKSVAQGIVTSFATFFLTFGAFQESVDAAGFNLDSHELFGCIVSTILVLVVTAQAALDTAYWTVFNHIVIWGSIILYFVMSLILSMSIVRNQYIGVFRKTLSLPAFWFTLALVLVILLVPVLAHRFYKLDTQPNLSDRCRYIQRISRRRTKPIEPQFRRYSSTRKSRRSIRSGYAFSHQEGFGNLITSGMIIKGRTSS